jgi:PhnB protein
MKAANPYLNFPGNTEEAFNFYKSVFGGEFQSLVRFGDFPDNSMRVPEHELHKIAHIALALGPDNVLMATDTLESWPPLTAGNNFSILLDVESVAEAERLFDGLSAGGTAEMPLQATAWAEKYGHCSDRFGIQWIVMYTGAVVLAAGSA